MSMFNILVVDDEAISADALAELLSDQLPDIRVSVAYHARQALSIIQDASFDLIISDIHMPGMTGMEMVAELRQTHPEISVIFLTGYDDFQYAYEAFQHSAVQYLLKTEGDERIVSEVKKELERIAQNQAIEGRMRDAEQQFARMLPMYRKQVLYSLLIGLGNYPDDELREMELYDAQVFMVVARCVRRPPMLEQKKRIIVLTAGEEIFQGALEDCRAESFLIESDFVWLLTPRKQSDYAEILFQLARKVRAHMQQRFDMGLFFVVANRAVDTNGLGGMYEEIRHMLAQKIDQDATGVAIDRGQVLPPTLDGALVKHMGTLRRQLDICQHDARDGAVALFREHARPILAFLDAPPPGAEGFAAECALTLTGMLMGLVNRGRFSVGTPAYLQLLTEDGGFSTGTADRIRDMIRLLHEENAQTMEKALMTTSHYVAAYVHEHIAEDISLQQLAAVTGYSIGYLSRVFKQQQGVGIHDFITMAKMNLAKELLCNTSLRVYEIAESCGYDNPTYFIKVFRKHVGMTPQEFKQENGQRGRR